MSDSEKTIAIVGASSRRSKYGNKAVRAWAQAGYAVYPINPKEDTIEGLTVYRSVEEIPGPVTYVSLYVAPAIGLPLLEGFKAKGVSKVFANPGTESPELLAQGEALGMEMMPVCSIMATGKTPMDFPDE